MGRPQKEIDQRNFEYLCSIMCTQDEIAGMFDCSIDTIERWCKRTYDMTFAEIYKKKSAPGKISLRRLQLKLAEKSAAMAIFLGKNYLGQKDTHEVAATATGKLADLIDGLKEPAEIDLYTEATGTDGIVENE